MFAFSRSGGRAGLGFNIFSTTFVPGCSFDLECNPCREGTVVRYRNLHVERKRNIRRDCFTMGSIYAIALLASFFALGAASTLDSRLDVEGTFLDVPTAEGARESLKYVCVFSAIDVTGILGLDSQ